MCLEFTADLPETDLELQRWLGEPGGEITGGSCWLFFDTDILTPHNWILGDGGGIMVGFFHMGHGTWGVFNIYIYIFVCLFDFGVLK